ncbi:hypothetical protein POM88_026622 [Heracleum sosnowskyi]|uniref:Uncharacterized protein n=1 Tax=Heracleum sosnowskyi TaxID=360622 RepID=A0AAD8MQ63_9APIA|nr:hypothetical protein POM88_026622 [Heracleum sosnowskyi]
MENANCAGNKLMDCLFFEQSRAAPEQSLLTTMKIGMPRKRSIPWALEEHRSFMRGNLRLFQNKHRTAQQLITLISEEVDSNFRYWTYLLVCCCLYGHESHTVNGRCCAVLNVWWTLIGLQAWGMACGSDMQLAGFTNGVGLPLCCKIMFAVLFWLGVCVICAVVAVPSRMVEMLLLHGVQAGGAINWSLKWLLRGCF